MAVKTIAFMLPWVDPLSANSNLYNAGVIARIETSIADRAITAGKALEINANVFDQSLNTTDSPTFAGLTVTGTSGNTDLTGHFITMDRASANYIQASDASGVLILGAGGSGGSYPSVRLNSNGDVVFYDGARTSQKFFWDASASSLGIGTTSPDNKIHVRGTSNLVAKFENTTASGNARAIFKTPSYEWNIGVNNSGGAFTLYDGTNNIVQVLSGAPSNSLYVNGSGNVGIGTTSPDTRLHVNAGGTNKVATFESTDPTVTLAMLDNNTTATGNGPNVLVRTGDTTSIYSGGSERITVLGTGNVGIATTNPSEKLHVGGNTRINGSIKFDTFREIKQASSTAQGMGLSGGTSNTTGASISLYGSTNSAQAGNLYLSSGGAASTGSIIFRNFNGSSFNTHMIVKNNGNVGIGTTSPDERLHVAGNVILTSGGLYRGEDTGGTVRTIFRAGTSDWFGFGDRIVVNYSAPTQSVVVNSSGNVGIGTTSPNTELDVDGTATANIIRVRRNAAAHSTEYLDISIGDRRAHFHSVQDESTGTGGGFQFDLGGSTSISDAFLISQQSDFASGTPSNTLFAVLASGNVGINTTSPSARLHANSGSANAVALFESTDAYAYAYLRDNSTTGDAYVGIGAIGNEMILRAGNADRVRVNSSGNVGIGTTGPSAKLHVSGATGAEFLRLHDQSTGARLSVDTYDNGGGIRGVTFAVSNDGSTPTDILNLRSTGIGINTNSPSAKLHVNGTVRLQNLPTSSSGLSSGDLWNDGGTLKIA